MIVKSWKEEEEEGKEGHPTYDVIVIIITRFF